MAKNLTVSSSRYCWQLVGLSNPLLGFSNHSFFFLTILWFQDKRVAFYSALDKDCEVSLYYIHTLSVVSSAGLSACICVVAPPWPATCQCGLAGRVGRMCLCVAAPPWLVTCWVRSGRQGWLHVLVCCGPFLTKDMLSALWPDVNVLLILCWYCLLYL